MRKKAVKRRTGKKRILSRSFLPEQIDAISRFIGFEQTMVSRKLLLQFRDAGIKLSSA